MPILVCGLEQIVKALDLDMFSATPTPFVVDQVVEQAQRYAERIYTIFRWAVTDEFLVRYGGKP